MYFGKYIWNKHHHQSIFELYTSNCNIIYHLFCQWQLPSNGTNCVSCVSHFMFSSFSVGEWTVLYWVSWRECNHLSSLETKVQFWYWTINASAIPSVFLSFISSSSIEFRWCNVKYLRLQLCFLKWPVE